MASQNQRVHPPVEAKFPRSFSPPYSTISPEVKILELLASPTAQKKLRRKYELSRVILIFLVEPLVSISSCSSVNGCPERSNTARNFSKSITPDFTIFGPRSS